MPISYTTAPGISVRLVAPGYITDHSERSMRHAATTFKEKLERVSAQKHERD